MVRDEPLLASPTGSVERIASLDLLRGIALLGMLVVHFHVHTAETAGLNDLVRTLVWRLVETKSHGTFALLFGAGFAIQLRRARARGGPFAGLYVRRLFILALFGFAAHALFGYNVLLGYAIWGIPLLLMRNWSTRALLLTACLSALSMSSYRAAADWYVRTTAGPAAATAVLEARRAEAVAVNEALHAAEAQESYRTLLAARLRQMAWFHAQPFFFLPNATLTLFIAGFLMIRHRLFEVPHAHKRLLGLVAVAGVLSWAADNWLLPGAGISSAGLLRDQWLTFAYVNGALLLLNRPAVLRALHPVADAGRMALTNYLLQIVALDLLFSGYGLGLGSILPVTGLTAALACFAVQTALSSFWLARWRFGPAEWLWRSLTYKRLQPMRRTALADAAAL